MLLQRISGSNQRILQRSISGSADPISGSCNVQSADQRIQSVDPATHQRIRGWISLGISGSNQRISGSNQRIQSADQRISGSADQRISGSADQRISGSVDQRISGSYFACYLSQYPINLTFDQFWGHCFELNPFTDNILEVIFVQTEVLP